MRNQVASASIRAALVRVGATQQDVASWLGLSEPAVSRRMSGELDWRLGELQTIARELNVPVVQLIDEPAATAVAAQ